MSVCVCVCVCVVVIFASSGILWLMAALAAAARDPARFFVLFVLFFA